MNQDEVTERNLTEQTKIVFSQIKVFGLAM